jgi:hypothetical protein
MARKEDIALWLGRARFLPDNDTVYVLDRKMSILMLDYDPGEGNEVTLPYDSANPKENQ